MPETTQKFRIGRDDACDLVLKDKSVSRRHADLMIEPDGGLEILDRESSGGTFLLRDGKEHSISRGRLRPTDSVRFGEYEITVKALLEQIRQLPARSVSPRKAATPPPPLPVKAARSTPPAAPTPSARPATATQSASAGRMTRCECGTIKKRGESCPSCGS